MSEYEERQRRIAAERAEWPALYQTIRDALALGFVPDAYGNVDGGKDGRPILRPPIKFYFPAGGIAYPMHVDGFGPGSRFGVWCYRDGSPDDLRRVPIWTADDHTGQCRPYGRYRQPAGQSWDDAIATCVAFGAHFRRWFVVADWIGPERQPSLTTAEWREVLGIDLEPKRAQLSLFEEPPANSGTLFQRAVRPLVRDLAPAERQTIALPRGLSYYQLENLIDWANVRRWERDGIPDVETWREEHAA